MCHVELGFASNLSGRVEDDPGRLWSLKRGCQAVFVTTVVVVVAVSFFFGDYSGVEELVDFSQRLRRLVFGA